MTIEYRSRPTPMGEAPDRPAVLHLRGEEKVSGVRCQVSGVRVPPTTVGLIVPVICQLTPVTFPAASSSAQRRSRNAVARTATPEVLLASLQCDASAQAAQTQGSATTGVVQAVPGRLHHLSTSLIEALHMSRMRLTSPVKAL